MLHLFKNNLLKLDQLNSTFGIRFVCSGILQTTESGLKVGLHQNKTLPNGMAHFKQPLIL